MRKVILLLILLCFVSFAFALPWGHRYAMWQANEDPSAFTNDPIIFAVEWSEGDWDAGGSMIGYGISTDGIGWTWTDIFYIENDPENANNKRCSTSVSISTQGNYYYAYRFIKGSETSYTHGSADWDENVSELAATNTVTITDAPTPICLASFVANAVKGSVELAWTTASETENSHFLVYRDDLVIGRVAGNDTCTDPHEYSFVDNMVTPGVHEYAIEDVTYGGETVMHEKIEVEVKLELENANFVLKKAYPNPFNPRTVIRLEYGVGSYSVVNIFNTQGVLVENLIDGFVEAGTHEVTWDASGMSSGVYLVTMQAGNTVQSQKIVLMK